MEEEVTCAKAAVKEVEVAPGEEAMGAAGGQYLAV